MSAKGKPRGKIFSASHKNIEVGVCQDKKS